MSATRWRTLALVALVALVLGVAGLEAWRSRGGVAPAVPWTAVLVEVLVAIAVLAAARPVRRWVRGGERAPRMEALTAARTAVFAKAASHTGALLAGWYAAQALVALPLADVEPQRARVLVAGASVVGALLVVAAGLVAERWCRVPPPPSEDDDRS